MGDSGEFNWIILDAEHLEMLNAGSGGLLEFQRWLAADKVLFCALRVPFAHNQQRMTKHVFVHWMGPRVSALARGKLNAKTTAAEAEIRKACPNLLFRKQVTEFSAAIVEEIVDEIRRCCVLDRESAHISVGHYFAAIKEEQRVLKRKAVEEFERRQKAEQAEKVAAERERQLQKQAEEEAAAKEAAAAAAATAAAAAAAAAAAEAATAAAAEANAERRRENETFEQMETIINKVHDMSEVVDWVLIGVPQLGCGT